MKSQKQAKILFGFGLSMMDKAIEMQHAKNKFQELKNEEIRLQSTQIKGEILELKSPFNEDEPIDEKLKSEVENDPLFKLFDDIFNPNKNKKIIDEIMKEKRFPSGGILVGIGKKRPNGEKDDCDCPACVLRRTLEGKERGFND
jgi:hypothetical protein